MILDSDLQKDEEVFSEVCSRCAHRVSTRERTCIAFPKGIPDVIWQGANKHTLPLPGQANTIVFEGE